MTGRAPAGSCPDWTAVARPPSSPRPAGRRGGSPRRRARVGVAAAVATLLATLYHGTAAAQTPAPDTQGRVLTGTVSEAGGGSVPGAVVGVAGTGLLREAITGPDGAYRVEVPGTGPWLIRVARLGYAPLRVEVRELPAGARLDFVLTPAPLPLPALEVAGTRSTPAFALLSGEASAGSAAAAAGDRVLRERVPPLAWALLPETAPHAGGTGGGGTPAPPSLQGGIGVRGAAGRPAASFLGGAPVHLVAEPSPLADPFAPHRRSVRVWDAGAPAHVGGGLEYVLEIGEPMLPPEPGSAVTGRLDLVRTGVVVTRRGRRDAIAAEAGTTLPWADVVFGGEEGTSRSAGLHVAAAPTGSLGVAADLSWRSLALALGTGADPDVRLDEATASVEGAARWAGGVLDARAGVGVFSAILPTGDPSTADGRLLERRGTSARLGYTRPLGRRWAVHGGVDLLRHRWDGLASASEPGARATLDALVVGSWLEAAWTPAGAVALRAGTRLERPAGGGAPLLSPRLYVRWAPAPDWTLELQSGTHRQVLPAFEDDGGPSIPGGPEPRAIMAAGHHVAATLSWARPGFELRTDVYRKRLGGLGRTAAPHRILGWSSGLVAAAGGLSGELAVGVERRSVPGHAVWSPIVRTDLTATLPHALEARARVVGAGSVGSAGVGALSPDTLGAPLRYGVSDLAAHERTALGLDLEVSRRWASGGRTFRPYLQVVNALGRRARALYRVDAGQTKPWEPRLLVLGVEIARLTPSTPARRPDS